MRRIAAALALTSMVLLPAVRQTRFFCRFTGAEIADCAEQRVPQRAQIDREGCCERRTTPSLSPARTGNADAWSAPALAPAPDAAPLQLISQVRSLHPLPRSIARGGPPLYLEQRTLLI
jgi:hypothetical protein